MNRSRRPAFGVAGVVLCLASVVVFLLAAEAALRIVHPLASLWRYPNYIAQANDPDPDQSRDLLQYSSELGYEPRPGASGILMHRPISYSAEGVRNQNVGSHGLPGRPIIAVGDSYTEGYAATDDETWPAQLERDLRRRVLNGGVRGYGLDQIVLRARQLAGRFDADTIVLAFIADDVRRSALSVSSAAHKPYFVPKGDALELRDVPVPPVLEDGPYAWPRRILGYSFLLDFVMNRLGKWDLWYGNSRSSGVDANIVACRLMPFFAGIVRDIHGKALVVALPQYGVWTDPRSASADRALTATVLECAKAAGLPTLDIHDAFVAAGAASNPTALYVDWHFNARGNRIVAKAIADALP